jgi:fatty-acyl-CoA synthase
MTSRPYIEDLVEALDRAGERSVLRRDGAGTSGRELLTATFRYARALESLGVTRGDLVALYAASRPAALAVRYATHLLGAASVYLSAPADPARREQMLRDFRPRLVVVFPETAALLPPVSAPCAAIGAVPAVPLDLAALAAGQDPGPRPSRARPGDQRAQGQRARLRPLHQHAGRAPPARAPPARQRQARLPDPGPG